MTIGQRIKQHRTARKLTQAALGTKVGMHAVYVARLESGAEPNPTINTLRKLAKALKCTVGELVE